MRGDFVMAVQTINKNFKETVLQAEGPVVVDFWAAVVRILPPPDSCC